VKVPERKNRKTVTRDSGWINYTTSSKEVNEDIKTHGLDNFQFDIMYECDTKGCLRYAEIHEQHNYNVLTSRDSDGEREWYNNAIGDVKFIPPKDEAYIQGENEWTTKTGRQLFTEE
jgi:hypothetical protein